MDSLGFDEFISEWYPQPFIVKENITFTSLNYLQPLGNQALLLGAQYRTSELDQDINGEESSKKAHDFGTFIQMELLPADIFDIIVGARYDMHKSEDELTGGKYNKNSISPRFAIRYSPDPTLDVRFNFGTGFKVPYLFSEDLHLCASAPRIYKSADLKPEKAISLSSGMDYYFGNHHAGLSLFHTAITDKVAFISADDEEIPVGYDYQWKNIGEAYTQGAEFTFDGFIVENLRYKLNMVYTIAKFKELRYTQEDYPSDDNGWEESDNIPRSPNITSGLGLTYTMRGWRLSINGNYTGPMYIDHIPGEDIEQLVIEKTDGFFLVDANISRKITNGVVVYAGGKNLTNYTQPKRDNSDAAYIWAPLVGRTMHIGMDFSF